MLRTEFPSIIALYIKAVDTDVAGTILEAFPATRIVEVELPRAHFDNRHANPAGRWTLTPIADAARLREYEAARAAEWEAANPEPAADPAERACGACGEREGSSYAKRCCTPDNMIEL